MAKKNLLIIILTALVFLAAAVLGVATVYRVDEVTVYAPVVSDEAKTEAATLKERLLEAYDKQSTLFADQAEADAVAKDFPYLRIVSFKKEYPNRLVFEVREDAEVYAAPVPGKDGSYYILNADGVVLGERDDPTNRSTGGRNVILKGTESAPLTVTGEKGKPLAGDDILPTLFSFAKAVNEKLDGIRRNVISIEVVRPASAAEQTLFKLATAEGVVLYVRNPAAKTAEKAARLVEEYAALGDKEKTAGVLLLYDNGEELGVYYGEEGIPNT